MVVMNNNQFIEKLKHIASLPTTYYSVAGGQWAKWNGKSWNFDCVILVKAILWGWNENKNHAHGGANYGSNGVFDDGTEQIIKRCSNVSTDFTKIEKGELLWMPGHVGVYIGNRQVIECTGAWERKVLYSNIDSNGARSKNGNYVGRWQKHGKLPYLKYETEVEKTNKTIEELAKEVIDGKWDVYPRRKELLEKAGYNYRDVQNKVNEMLAPKVKYLHNPNYKGNSIVDGLKGIGVDSSFSYRSKLAKINGISDYRGSAEQNTKMLNMLKKGILKSL